MLLKRCNILFYYDIVLNVEDEKKQTIMNDVGNQ